MSGAGSLAAHGVQRGNRSFGTGWTHHRLRWLPDQPTLAQTGGRNLWLDENGGGIQAHPLSRSRADAGLGLFRSRDLQFTANNQPGIEFAGRMKDAVDQWVAPIGRKTRSKQPREAAAEQKSALRNDQ